MAPAVVGTIAVILSLHVTLTCHFVALLAPKGYSQNRGIWYLQGYERIGDSDDFKDVCTPYPSVVHMDSKWYMIRLATLVGGILGSGVASYLWSCMYSPLTKRGWNMLAIACFVTAILQGFTLTFVGSSGCQKSEWLNESSKRSCVTTTGYDVDVVATIGWILTGLVMTMIPPHLQNEKLKNDSIQETSKEVGIPGSVAKNARSVRNMSMRDIEGVSHSENSGSCSDNEAPADKPLAAGTSSVNLLERDDLPEVC